MTINRPRVLACATAALCLWGIASCGDPSEAPQVRLPVVVDAVGVESITTNLGYEIELSRVHLVTEDIVFTVAGEVHTASLLQSVSDLIVPRAYAHPGHYQGGEVTGELRGRFFLTFRAPDDELGRGRELYADQCARCHGEFAEGLIGPNIGGHPAIAEVVSSGRGEMPAFELSADEVASIQTFLGTRVGVATLLGGTYESANFTFSSATAEDGLGDGGLTGHTALLVGTAVREGQTWSFTILVDSPDGRQLVGAPFDTTLDSSSEGQIDFRLEMIDPLEGDTLFDDIDFASLDPDMDGEVRIESQISEVEDAYNLFRRTFQTHDHWVFHHVE